MAEHEGCKSPSFAGIVDGQSVDHGVGLMAFQVPGGLQHVSPSKEMQAYAMMRSRPSSHIRCCS